MIVHAPNREGVSERSRRVYGCSDDEGRSPLRPMAVVFRIDSLMFDEGTGAQLGHRLA